MFKFLVVTTTVIFAIFGKVAPNFQKPVLASQTVRLTASADAAVSPLAPTANTGSSQILELKRAGATWNDDYAPYSSALVKFDLAQIPTGSTITEAKLKLYVNSLYVGGPSSARVGVFAGQADREWSEYQVNFRTMPGIVGDIAEEYYLPDGYVGLVTLDVTSLVSEWVSGSAPNYGFLIYSDVLGNSYDMKLASREAGSAGPLLGIVYETLATSLARYPGLSSDLMSRLMGFASAYQGGQTPDFSGLADLFNSDDWQQGMRDFMSQFENFIMPDPTGTIPTNGGLPIGLGQTTGTGGMGLSGSGQSVEDENIPPPPDWLTPQTTTTSNTSSGTNTSGGSKGSDTTSGMTTSNGLNGSKTMRGINTSNRSNTSAGDLTKFLPFIIGGVVIGGALLMVVIVVILIVILSKKKKTETSETSLTPKKSSTGKIIAGCCGCGCLVLILLFVLMSFGPFMPFGFFSLFGGGL